MLISFPAIYNKTKNEFPFIHKIYIIRIQKKFNTKNLIEFFILNIKHRKSPGNAAWWILWVGVWVEGVWAQKLLFSFCQAHSFNENPSRFISTAPASASRLQLFSLCAIFVSLNKHDLGSNRIRIDRAMMMWKGYLHPIPQKGGAVVCWRRYSHRVAQFKRWNQS